MNYTDLYDFWKADELFDISIRSELAAFDSEKDIRKIEDRFYRDFEFGTGGLRGVMGAGINCMNKGAVGKAIKWLGYYLVETYGSVLCKARSVVIGYDTRNNSEYFSRTVANVLNVIRIYFHTYARPIQ